MFYNLVYHGYLARFFGCCKEIISDFDCFSQENSASENSARRYILYISIQLEATGKFHEICIWKKLFTFKTAPNVQC